MSAYKRNYSLAVGVEIGEAFEEVAQIDTTVGEVFLVDKVIALKFAGSLVGVLVAKGEVYKKQERDLHYLANLNLVF